jgi:hypothetical protein
MNRIVNNLLVTAMLSCLPVLARAQEFSADVIYFVPGQSHGSSAPAPHEPSKLVFSKGKMRLETRGLTGTILLVNFDDHTTYALFPQQKAYQPLTSGPSEYFHITNADNACPDWQAVAGPALACEKVGPEVVDGRQTIKYKNNKATPASPLSTVWIDPSLNFIVKWEAKDTGAQLQNISNLQTPATGLFDLPEGYELLKPKKKGPKGPKGPSK